MYKSETLDFQKPQLNIKPIEEIKTDKDIHSYESLVKELKDIDDAPITKEDDISIEDKYIEIPKKKKKRKPSQKQLDHLARIREKSRLAREKKKQARNKDKPKKQKVEKVEVKNVVKNVEKKEYNDIPNNINTNNIIQSSNNIIDYDILSNKLFQKFKESDMFYKREIQQNNIKTQEKKIETPKINKVETPIKKPINKKHQALLNHFRANRNRRKKGWV